MIFIIMLIIILTACQTTKYITVPMSRPPIRYEIGKIEGQKGLIKEYQKSVMMLAEWQSWYNVQANSNYFNYNDKK